MALPEADDLLPFVHARIAEDAERASTPREHREVMAKQLLLADAEGSLRPDPGVQAYGRILGVDMGPFRAYHEGRGDLAWTSLVVLAAVYEDHEDYRPEFHVEPEVWRGA